MNSSSLNKTKPPFYGTPVPGSKTEARAKQAHVKISSEILQLCDVIERNGSNCVNGGVAVIAFIDLFNIYIHISNKLVGVLLRARKHHLVQFEGETLFQGRDNDKIITLLKSTEDIRRELRKEKGNSNNFTWGNCI